MMTAPTSGQEAAIEWVRETLLNDRLDVGVWRPFETNRRRRSASIMRSPSRRGM